MNACELHTAADVITMSSIGVGLSSLVFLVVVFLMVHFYNNTTDVVTQMGKPERFAMELLSSTALAIVIMFILGCVEMTLRAIQ